MKRLFICCLLPGLTVAPALSAPQTSHYWVGSFASVQGASFRALAKSVDTLALVQLEEAGASTSRVYTQGDRSGPVRCDRYRMIVLRSPDCQEGAEITCVNAIFGMNKTEPLTKGTYLLLAKRPQGGALSFPDGFAEFDQKVTAPFDRKVPADSPSEQSVLLLFSTDCPHLPSLSDRGEQIGTAIVQCWAGAPAEDRSALFRFVLGSLRDPNLDQTPRHPNQGDAWSKSVQAVADSMPPLDRARLYSLLIFWEVMGTEEKFLDALSDAAASEQGLEREQFMLTTNLLFARPHEAGVPGDYAFRPDPDDFVRRALASRNSEATKYFIHNLPGMPRLDSLKELAQLLNSQDRGVREELVKLFCHLNPEQPIRIQYSGPRNAITNLDDVVRFWHDYYGVKTSLTW